MDGPHSKAMVVVAFLALSEGGFMVADSIHRFSTGDFFRIDGQLGPWSAIVSGVGGDPMAMGPLFFVVGAIQVLGGIGTLIRRPWATRLTLVMAVGTLWYLIFGTLSSAVQIGLLVRQIRSQSSLGPSNSERE